MFWEFISKQIKNAMLSKPDSGETENTDILYFVVYNAHACFGPKLSGGKKNPSF